MAAPCFYCHKFHDPGERCSSGSSACSGADARLADKASEPKIPNIPNSGSGKVGAFAPKAAVSPRPSDGKIADKALDVYRLLDGVASHGVGYVLLEDRLVRISIESHKITDESRDG